MKQVKKKKTVLLATVADVAAAVEQCSRGHNEVRPGEEICTFLP